MTQEQIELLKTSLLQNGIEEKKVDEIITALLAKNSDIVTPEVIDPIEDFIIALLEKEPIKNVINAMTTFPEKKIEARRDEQVRFLAFLTRLDKLQKIYNIIFMVIGCGVIYGLKATDVIKPDTATTLVTIIITASLADAITSFMKTQKKD